MMPAERIWVAVWSAARAVWPPRSGPAPATVKTTPSRHETPVSGAGVEVAQVEQSGGPAGRVD